MSHKKRGQLKASPEWAKHLRPFLRRFFWKGERREERDVERSESVLAPEVDVDIDPHAAILVGTYATPAMAESDGEYNQLRDPEAIARRIEKLRKEMVTAANNLEFEKAAKVRDEVFKLEAKLIAPV